MKAIAEMIKKNKEAQANADLYPVTERSLIADKNIENGLKD
jgi:hypothetical protein